MKPEEKAKEVYIRCFDDEFKYPDVLNALRICAEETQKEKEDYIKKLLQSNIDQHNKIVFLSAKVNTLQKQVAPLQKEVANLREENEEIKIKIKKAAEQEARDIRSRFPC